MKMRKMYRKMRIEPCAWGCKRTQCLRIFVIVSGLSMIEIILIGWEHRGRQRGSTSYACFLSWFHSSEAPTQWTMQTPASYSTAGIIFLRKSFGGTLNGKSVYCPLGNTYPDRIRNQFNGEQYNTPPLFKSLTMIWAICVVLPYLINDRLKTKWLDWNPKKKTHMYININ